MKHIDTRIAVDTAEIDEWKRKLNIYASNARSRRSKAEQAIRRFFNIDNRYGFDGIKRASKRGDPKPFSGSANNAVQWGDMALDTELSIAMETYRLAEREVVPIAGGGSTSDEYGHKLSLILSWAINHIDDFEDQYKLALKYMFSNSPGVAAVQILWNKRAIYGPRRITREELMQAIAAAAPEGTTPDTLVDLVTNDMPSEQVLTIVQSLTGAPINLCEKIFEALLTDEACEYPGIIGYDEGPAIKAMEFGTDFVLPDYCTSFDLCELWCRQEWVNAAQLYDLAASNNWDPEFVEETLKHGGESVSSDLFDVAYNTDEFEDLYHIVYVYTAERNKEGVLTRYQTVISCAQGLTACGKEMLRGRRGRYPAIFITREKLTENITRARGLAEIGSPLIDLAKKLANAGSNNALVGSLPPVLAKGTDSKLTLKPLQVIKVRPSSEVKFLQPPAYPAQGSAEYRRLKDEFYERFGLPTKDSDPNTVLIRRRERMAIVVRFLRQLLTGMISIVQAHATPKLFANVLGKANALAVDPRLRMDLDGAYQVALKVNVDELDRDTLISKIQTLGNTLPVLDRRLEANTAPILKHAVRMLFPTAADEVLTNTSVGAAQEIRDERNNFVQIKAGVRPEMNSEGGWNYEVRLGVWQQLLETNPNLMNDWSPEAQQYAQEWMQALQHLAQQYGENASVGRTGSEMVQPMR